MNRAQLLKRLVAISTTGSLALAVLGTGAATAADSRILYVGSGPLPAGHGVLTPTAVTQGGATKIDVTVLNGDNQNIANTVLYFPVNGTPLAPGLTVSYVFGPDAGFCTPTGAAAATSVRCDFGNLRAGASRTVSILVDVASNFPLTAATPLFTVNVETNNENGSNSQVFQASSGSFAVQAPGSSLLGTYVKPGITQTQTLGTSGELGSANKLTTAVSFKPSQANGNLVQIVEESGVAVEYVCPAGLVCQSEATTVDIDDGSGDFSASPYLTWQLTAQVPKTFTLSKAFVAHYPTGATASDWQLFWNTKTDKCGSNPGATLAASGQCIMSATLSRPDRTTGLATLTIVVLTDHNGGMRF